MTIKPTEIISEDRVTYSEAERMSKYYRGGPVWKFVRRHVPYADALREYLPRLLFHPLPIICAAIVFGAGSYLTGRWVQSGERFASYSFQNSAANLSEHVHSLYQTSIKLLDGFRPESEIESWSFSEQEWQTLVSTLKGLKGEHVVGTAWYVKVEERPSQNIQKENLFKKKKGKKLIISSQPLEKEVKAIYPKFGGMWSQDEGGFVGSEVPEEQPSFVLDAAFRAVQRREQVSFRERAHDAGFIVAAPVYCAADPLGRQQCYEAIVFALQGQLALDALVKEGKIPEEVSAGLRWVGEDVLVAAHPPTMTPPMRGDSSRLQYIQTFSLGHEVLEVIFDRSSRFIGVTDRQRMIPTVHAALGTAAGLVYLLLVLILCARRIKRDEALALQHRLEAKERQLVTLSDASPFGIMITGPGYDCLYANPAVEKLLDLSRVELLGDRWLDTLEPEVQQELITTWMASSSADSESVERTLTLRVGAEGKKITTSAVFLPMFQGETLVGNTIIFNDQACTRNELMHERTVLTDREAYIFEIEEELKQVKQDLEHKARELQGVEAVLQSERVNNAENPRVRSGFLSGLRDDLRSPLSNILQTASTIREIADEIEGADTAATEICSNSERALGILDDLLDFTKIDSRKVDVEQIACSPIGLLEEIEKVIYPKAEAEGVSYGRDVIGTLPDTILTDRFRLRRILQHLISNALSFTKHGGVKVCVRLDEKESTLHYDIIDTGPGIEADTLKAVFADQSELSESELKRVSGLRNTVHLIREINAEVDFDTKLGRGTTVEVTLKVERAPHHVEKSVSGSEESSVRENDTVESKDGPINH